MSPQQVLERYWGHKSFRPLQAEIIGSVLAGKDTIAILPTGGGKSLCYQVPALLQDGFTLVISPLIALMQDQVARLREMGIMCACIHAGMNYYEVRSTLENMLHGPFKLLYVSPERLQSKQFLDYLPDLNISLIAVDEAHCISQWGHDFRPDYLRISELRDSLPDVPVLALTASATPQVQEDIIKQLMPAGPALFEQGISRSNLFYEVKYSEQKPTDLRASLPKGESSIIYCRSRKQTEALARQLNQNNINAAAYHAGMDKEKRSATQLAWMQDQVPVIAATTAFGMGIDKANVRAVIHYDSPEHLEAYYQEAGRCGRDGQEAHAVLLYNTADLKRLQESTDLHFPPEDYLRKVYQSVAEYLEIPIGMQPDRYYSFDLADFCAKFHLELMPASHALRLLAQEELWTISEAVFHPASIQFTTDRHSLDNIVDTYPELGYIITGLLRLYGSIFHYPTSVRITAVARQLKISREMLEQGLQQLQQMEVLEYIKPAEGPQMLFHHLRADSRYLLIDRQRINTLRALHEKRTLAMMAYLENTVTCRERMMRQYFGEQAHTDCGHCDICRSKAATTEPDGEALLKELRGQLALTDKLSLKDFISQYPLAVKDQLISRLRYMADEGIIILSADTIRIID